MALTPPLAALLQNLQHPQLPQYAPNVSVPAGIPASYGAQQPQGLAAAQYAAPQANLLPQYSPLPSGLPASFAGGPAQLPHYNPAPLGLPMSAQHSLQDAQHGHGQAPGHPAAAALARFQAAHPNIDLNLLRQRLIEHFFPGLYQPQPNTGHQPLV